MSSGASPAGQDGPAVRYEERVLPPVHNPDLLSRRAAERRRAPYLAAVPPAIAAMPFTIPTEVVAEVDDASRTITRFDGEFAGFPAPFSAVLLRSESASSSQIEHLTSGARAIAEAEIDERIQGNAPLIVRNVRAMEAAIALADDISDATIIEMHRQLLESSAPRLVGGYRAEQVWIGGALPHDAAFVPPHHERVADAMADLVAFTRRTDLPVLVQAAVAHAQFETIHPFPDGNGRTGRALVQAILRNGRLIRHMTIPVSSGILTDVDAYFDALDAYRRGDVAPIVAVFATASLAALRNATVLAEDLARLQREWDGRLTGLRADSTARRLARVSIEHPALNARLARERTGASQPAVDNALQQLTERGILRMVNGQRRNRVWLNPEVLDALDAFAERSGRRQDPSY
ncbi:Fic family protein [Curtobacterium sp. MCBD17_013]|uniref:Fic family protein n=1 Tax=unclassified Curtobacterium TaxID=257496 RepID=UPI000DA8F989|nr:MULTISPECIES: Fic family protein [unclassified Curtobacterium]PZF63327.1 Fic family protein [Curtobacterium sp. MCBD17_013]WIB64248.1 Fic family protein [Curtobacterium sp. MCBD17_040]